MSAGTRSGVNCRRANVPPTAVARVSTASVLATPGTPSSRQCPRASRRDEHPLDQPVLADDHPLDLEQRALQPGGVDRRRHRRADPVAVRPEGRSGGAGGAGHGAPCRAGPRATAVRRRPSTGPAGPSLRQCPTPAAVPAAVPDGSQSNSQSTGVRPLPTGARTASLESRVGQLPPWLPDAPRRPVVPASVDLALRVLPELLAQLELLDLAGRGPRDRVAELDRFGAL